MNSCIDRAGTDGCTTSTYGHRGDDRHRAQISFQVVPENLALQGVVDRVGGERAHQDRVAIALRLRDRFGADVAARARAVVDDHLLPKLFRQPLRKDAADESAAPPGGNGTIIRTGLAG